MIHPRSMSDANVAQYHLASAMKPTTLINFFLALNQAPLKVSSVDAVVHWGLPRDFKGCEL
jgi:hypothetical protein